MLLSIKQSSFFSVFFQEVRANLEHRVSHGLPHQDPNVLIDLYNSAVEHLELVCMQVKNLVEVYILKLWNFLISYIFEFSKTSTMASRYPADLTGQIRCRPDNDYFHVCSRNTRYPGLTDGAKMSSLKSFSHFVFKFFNGNIIFKNFIQSQPTSCYNNI